MKNAALTLALILFGISATAQSENEREDENEQQIEKAEMRIEFLTNNLELEEEQVAQLRALMEKHQEKMEALRAQLKKERMTLKKSIQAILNKEQRGRLMELEMDEEHMRKNNEEHEMQRRRER